MAEIRTGMSFDHGIEQVSISRGQANAELPRIDEFVPGSTAYTDKLQNLLFQPSIEQSLLASLKPAITQRELLKPERYKSIRQDCSERLSELAEQEVDPDRSEVLGSGAKELQGQHELGELLTTLRNLLHSA